ncbi:V-type ATPase, subunit F family protein [Enterococcus sp. DIV0876]|uniref:V-type ATPase, subunit F family protein n=1 Tax=Enterococcus sp. DIV0876 TaxID=2774633 RepID=UPI003D2FFB02
MKEALDRLRAAEEANQQEMLALQQALQAERTQSERQLQQQIKQAEEDAAEAYAALETEWQQKLATATDAMNQEHQQLLAQYQKNWAIVEQEAVAQIVEGVIQNYGSHEIN